MVEREALRVYSLHFLSRVQWRELEIRLPTTRTHMAEMSLINLNETNYLENNNESHPPPKRTVLSQHRNPLSTRDEPATKIRATDACTKPS